ncbi:MAG: WYL domain-containing protein, partial [Bacteroidaceae bacterium]|nr:WYL domain-containing protein [Bacteroidaceae bacterium]
IITLLLGMIFGFFNGFLVSVMKLQAFLEVPIVDSSNDTKIIRIVQYDIKALEEEHDKKITRNREWDGSTRRGVVRYADDEDPLFLIPMTADEKEILTEAIQSLGRFDGMESFQWIERLKNRWDIKVRDDREPFIVFDKGQGVKKYRKMGESDNNEDIRPSLMGNLFIAISRQKVIRFRYTTEYRDKTQVRTVFPYQLRQYDSAWYLIAGDVDNANESISNFPLDRFASGIDYVDDIDFRACRENLEERFSEIVGVTLTEGNKCEEIIFAVDKEVRMFIHTKPIHSTQVPLDEKRKENYLKRYPSLNDWWFYTIECRPNNELFNRFMSRAGHLVVLEPERVRNKIARRAIRAAELYVNTLGEKQK